MKRIFIVLVMLITSIIPIQYNGDINSTNEELIQNTIANEIAIESVQNEITKDDEINVTQNDENQNLDVLSTQDEIVVDKQETIQNNKQTKNNSVSQNNNATEHKVQENAKPKEEKQPSPTPAPKEEPKQEKVTTPKQEAIYCVDGGKTHIYGDGANEHGYYKTWAEAFNAYEEYTKGWDSTQFKVDQCACGLYYFWVTK